MEWQHCNGSFQCCVNIHLAIQDFLSFDLPLDHSLWKQNDYKLSSFDNRQIKWFCS